MYLGGACELGLIFCLLWFLGAHFVADVIYMFSLMYIHASIAIFAFLLVAFVSYAFVGKCFSYIHGMLECAICKIVGKHVWIMGMIG